MADFYTTYLTIGGVKFMLFPSDCGPEENPHPFIMPAERGQANHTRVKALILEHAIRNGLVVCEFKRDGGEVRAMLRPAEPGEAPGKAACLQ